MALVVALIAFGAWAATPRSARASSGRNARASLLAPAPAADACSEFVPVQPSALFSNVLKTSLPLISAIVPEVPPLSQLSVPIPTSPVAPAQTSPEVSASIATMRALPEIDVRWQATFLAPMGSGWLTITPPDTIDGLGTMVLTSWNIKSRGESVAVVVNDRPIGDLPSRGLAASLRDAMVALPCYAPNVSVQTEGNVERIEGRLSAGNGSEVLRQLIGLAIPGNPIGEMTLTIDSSTKVWQALDLRLVWAVLDVDVMGRRITWGPSGRVMLTFGDEQTQAVARPSVLPRSSPSTAQIVFAWLESSPPLHPYAHWLDTVFTFLDLRQTATMIDEDAWRRATLIEAWQRHGPGSDEYRAALREYRAWQEQIPLIGPVLHEVLRPAAGP